jgi:hypothetical protein
VAGTKIDEAFIGSCMTNIGHFRAAAKLLGGQRDIPVKLWVAPPTKMDQSELIKEGHYAAFGTAGARTEMPGCSLCMGNQAQVREGATVVSTSTRNFPNRLGKNTNVYLASAELAAIASKLGNIPTVAEYHAAMGIINKDTASVYKYLNFDQIEEYAETALVGLLVACQLLATATWWRHGRTPRTKVSRRSLRRSTWHAALLAAIWCVPTLVWFPGGDAAQQLLVATLVTGMMGAGAYVLSPLPLASLAWSGIFTASAMGALWRAGNPAMLGTALMLAFYAPMVAIGSFSASRKQASLLRANARTERQERMLAVLLQDFEQSAEDALWQTGA